MKSKKIFYALAKINQTKIFLIVLLFTGFHSCEEGERYASDGNGVQPEPPVYNGVYKPLPGGVRLYYDTPDKLNALSVDAEHTTEAGKVLRFSASFYADSLDVFGFVDAKPYDVTLYSTSSGGVKSTTQTITVTPLESALPKVFETLDAIGAVNSFFVNWENENMQNVNVFADFTFKLKGTNITRNLTTVFTSNALQERRTIYNLELDEGETVAVKLYAEDLYGNRTEVKEMGNIEVLFDEELNKTEWYLPPSGFVMGGVTMVNGSENEGRIEHLTDGLINSGEEVNYMTSAALNPWNLIIDLGAKYELTRIITWQRRFGEALQPPESGVAFDPNIRQYDKGILYGGVNVGRYRMWRWDDELNVWEELSEHRIPIPSGMTDIDIIRLHNTRGDEAYIHPDQPRFSKPTRYFRYQALNDFTSEYRGTGGRSISELSLFGRKFSD